MGNVRFQYSLLCPRPRKLEAGAGELSLSVEPKLELAGLDATPAAQRLLRSTAVAFVSTLGPSSQPQVTPIWFMFDGKAVSFSLVEGRQKLANLRRELEALISTYFEDNTMRQDYLLTRAVKC